MSPSSEVSIFVSIIMIHSNRLLKFYFLNMNDLYAQYNTDLFLVNGEKT